MRFNIYLLLLTALWSVTGCQSPETKRQNQLATLRAHIEVSRTSPGQPLEISVLRAAPINLYVERNPFLNENHVATAEVVETPGGFKLTLRLNRQGQWLLEQYTAANPNRRVAIRSQWGAEPETRDRWIAAPLFNQRVKDGVLTFTPDTSREEADEIAIGLNNLASKGWLKETPGQSMDSGGPR